MPRETSGARRNGCQDHEARPIGPGALQDPHAAVSRPGLTDEGLDAERRTARHGYDRVRGNISLTFRMRSFLHHAAGRSAVLGTYHFHADAPSMSRILASGRGPSIKNVALCSHSS